MGLDLGQENAGQENDGNGIRDEWRLDKAENSHVQELLPVVVSTAWPDLRS